MFVYIGHFIVCSVGVGLYPEWIVSFIRLTLVKLWPYFDSVYLLTKYILIDKLHNIVIPCLITYKQNE